MNKLALISLSLSLSLILLTGCGKQKQPHYTNSDNWVTYKKLNTKFAGVDSTDGRSTLSLLIQCDHSDYTLFQITDVVKPFDKDGGSRDIYRNHDYYAGSLFRGRYEMKIGGYNQAQYNKDTGSIKFNYDETQLILERMNKTKNDTIALSMRMSSYAESFYDMRYFPIAGANEAIKSACK